MLEVDRQAKRIEMLEEANKRRLYELDQVRDRQAKRIEMLEETVKRKDKDIEILKTELLRYTKALLNLAEYVLPQRYRDETLQILGYGEVNE